MKRFTPEVHYINTEDGYILKVYRITNFKETEEKNNTPKPIVFFQHGLGDSSDSWFGNKDELVYPYYLAKNGYDVWIGNNRGNKHSNEHLVFDKDSKEYWNFSFHEMGLYDLPAMVNHALEKTNQPNLTYIGHSQGSSQAFVLCSLKPDFCKQKMKAFISLGPAVFIDHQESKLLSLGIDLDIDIILEKLGMNKIFTSQEDTNKLFKFFCSTFGFMCNGFLDLVADRNTLEINNMDRMPVFFAHYPSGISIGCLDHFGALIRTKKFINYKTGDEYPIENITVPLYLNVGMNDLLSDATDDRRLKEVLMKNKANALKSYIEYEDLGHAGFFMTKYDVLFNSLIKQISDINSDY